MINAPVSGTRATCVTCFNFGAESIASQDQNNWIFPSGFNLIWLSSPLRKNISIFFRRKSSAYDRYPVPVKGRWPSSRTLGRGAVDAGCVVAHGSAGRVLGIS
jgi:hypothetical protein